MKFEYDIRKSLKNKKKQGIDFETAQELWNDSNCIIFRARSDDEERFAILALLKSTLWIVFFTYREEKVRIISVRKTRKGEKSLYEN
ncbi:MAG TPA: BrnT family toxin [Verrucomicrobiales bacterium]|nr:BrnT family toxin [Verrucomicrobiales bacterium]HIL70874.1 BrnT family toxin [Verrucomicrobiota bacterium]